jgi:hypothetical protein
MVETRGRTGRPPTAAERKSAAREARQNRYDRPPSWRTSANRAVIAVVLFIAVVLLAFKQPIKQAAFLAVFMLLIYIPMGYYTDLFMYRRRQAKKLQAQQQQRQAKGE